ncbi:MAG: rhodanese-like domain-containing protein [Planctomycetota bacterium]|jgi:rhodanese-related sulfurtransferase
MISNVCAETEQKQKLPKANIKYRSSGPYCGLYCLYAVIKATGKDIDFRNLLKGEYLGSWKGSSLSELKKAAEDHGLNARLIGKLTSRELRNSQYPIILHTKSNVSRKEYDHYELFLGIKDGKARLFDPPNPIKSVPFHELAPRWDGIGVVISAKPIDLGIIFAPARKRAIMCVAIAVVVILLVRWGRRRWLPSAILIARHQLLELSAVQGIGLIITAFLCGMVYHFANDEGFLAHANATTSVQQAHTGNFIPKVSKAKVEKLLGTDTVFIDARFARDFKAGHMEGAISVPVDANDTERYKSTAGIGKDAPIVIYCQSAGCKFAEKVTIKLNGDGFRNISIFKGGWNEWKAKNND